MVIKRTGASLTQMFKEFVRHPRTTLASQNRVPAFLRGIFFAHERSTAGDGDANEKPAPGEEVYPSNPLMDYFNAHEKGPGVFKWLHYFEMYHRHLAKFVGKDVHVMEIGVYSGGSLGMWRSYFGAGARITGVDIEPVCKAYENEHTKIVIGDQGDPSFWRRILADSPPIDVLIDDGGHTPEQQMVTLEQVLPRMKPGGVFICEDVHHLYNDFSSFVSGLDDALNAFRNTPVPPKKGDIRSVATPFQSWIHSIHHYPYAVVIEKHEKPITSFDAVRHGTEWQPFMGGRDS
ncbi:class I SAM-dependent methyltransferase [Paludisphaera borealis]|uniref:8-demethyl-8-alpha-L-rhamnosyl tetracenomycin-C 2'-O-methyltransferase n=1 Tax=Paludisphaera borealis TaxID=1387353 RepID=A0A1U7CT07_9BACT|nr:class I SAM-dependent methyltransferase [Paludisphaera borealis]APW62075.1 8-demethyl-8-alpha-L-rhamnosyl tetracenomycin-C 2'-O-methyltransferase [Paludisphaera borealis]